MIKYNYYNKFKKYKIKYYNFIIQIGGEILLQEINNLFANYDEKIKELDETDKQKFKRSIQDTLTILIKNINDEKDIKTFFNSVHNNYKIFLFNKLDDTNKFNLFKELDNTNKSNLFKKLDDTDKFNLFKGKILLLGINNNIKDIDTVMDTSKEYSYIFIYDSYTHNIDEKYKDKVIVLPCNKNDNNFFDCLHIDNINKKNKKNELKNELKQKLNELKKELEKELKQKLIELKEELEKELKQNKKLKELQDKKKLNELKKELENELQNNKKLNELKKELEKELKEKLKKKLEEKLEEKLDELKKIFFSFLKKKKLKEEKKKLEFIKKYFELKLKIKNYNNKNNIEIIINIEDIDKKIQEFFNIHYTTCKYFLNYYYSVYEGTHKNKNITNMKLDNNQNDCKIPLQKQIIKAIGYKLYQNYIDEKKSK